MNIFVWNCLKSQRKKKFFFSLIFLLLRYPLTVFWPPLPKVGYPDVRMSGCLDIQMSNIFRDSESLGKSNGKKWSNIWTFLFVSGLKSPRKKKFFCCCRFWLGPPSYGIGATIRIGREMLCLPYAGFFLMNWDKKLYIFILYIIFINLVFEHKRML